MNSRYPHYPTICTLLSLLFLQGCGGGSGGTDGSGVIQDPPTFTHSKLDTAGKQPLFVQIASNSNGDAIIAWQYFERNIDTSVWSNRFTPGLGWSAAKNVFDPALVGDLRVSMDGNGDAAFMTTRSDERTASGIPDVFANTEISGVVGNQQQLALASVRGKITAGLPGESVAVGGWEHVEAKGLGRDTFETAEYRLGAGWTRPIPIPILTSTEQDSSFHQINHSAVVALEPGRRLAVVNTNKKLRYNVGSSEGDWNAAANVITSSGIDPLSVHFLAAGGNGRAVLVWVDFLSGGADYRVLSTWFNGVSWGPIESIATQTGIIVFEDSFQVAADAQGNAVVVWEHITATAGKTIRSVRFRDGQWEAPIELSSTGADPSLSVNARGDTAAVWVEIPGVIVGRSFSAQNPTTWSDPVPLTKVAGGNAFEPKVAIQPGGLVIVVWTKIHDASLWSTAGRIE